MLNQIKPSTMKATILLGLFISWVGVTTAQKHPKGVEDPKKEFFIEHVSSLTWVKHRLKKDYYFAGSNDEGEQLQIYGEVKRILSLYNLKLEDAFLDVSSFCEGTNFTDFEAMQKGFERFQEANLVYHLYDDWVLEIQMGYSVNSLVIHQWKNEDWSIWEEDPVAEGVEVINTLISE